MQLNGSIVLVVWIVISILILSVVVHVIKKIWKRCRLRKIRILAREVINERTKMELKDRIDQMESNIESLRIQVKTWKWRKS